MTDNRQLWLPGFWKPMKYAPRNAKWILGLMKDGTEKKVHYAKDLSGEEQPPFDGWFEECGSYFREVYPPPIGWKDL